MRIGITYGTFDVLHYGHINLLRRAKEDCDYLIVGLSTDEFNKVKGKKSYYPYWLRKQMLEAIRYVDLIIPEESWEQKSRDIADYYVDVLYMGNDWKGQFDWVDCETIYFPRTPKISSTEIRKILEKTE